MLVGISCGLVSTVGFHLIVRENSSSEDEDETNTSNEKTPPSNKISIKSWLVNPSLYFVGSVYMATRLYLNLTQAYIPFYLQVSAGNNHHKLTNIHPFQL